MRMGDLSSDVCSSDLVLELWGRGLIASRTRGSRRTWTVRESRRDGLAAASWSTVTLAAGRGSGSASTCGSSLIAGRYFGLGSFIGTAPGDDAVALQDRKSTGLTSSH